MRMLSKRINLKYADAVFQIEQENKDKTKSGNVQRDDGDDDDSSSSSSPRTEPEQNSRTYT